MILDETFMPRGTSAMPSMESRSLVVGDLEEVSHVAGPGVRSVVWVAGCHRRCPGCMKPELFAFDAGRVYSVDELFERLAGIDGVDGVTFSGGEPFEQPCAVAQLAVRLRALGRDVLVYTGYRYEELIAAEHDGYRRLLGVTDILIEGEYRADVSPPGRWRGSANQRLMALTQVGQQRLEVVATAPSEEIQVAVHGTRIRLMGCPSRGFYSQFIREMRMRGVVIVPSAGGGHE